MCERSGRVEGPGTYVTERDSHCHFYLARCSLDCPTVLRWLSPVEGWDAAGINCKKGTTTENQGTDVNDPSLMEGESHGLLCVAGELYFRAIIKRIGDKTDCAVGEDQCGFMRSRKYST